MKKFIIKILCGILVFSCLPILNPASAANITAVKSSQKIYVDGLPVNMLAYNIGGEQFREVA